jgi:hypothetical protein
MTPVTIHFRGEHSEQQRLPAVPSVGSYVFGPEGERRLWEVSAVVLDNQAVEVFALEVSPRLASELTAAWATWGESKQGA